MIAPGNARHRRTSSRDGLAGSDLSSLAERSRHLIAVRVVLVLAVIGITAFWPPPAVASARSVAVATGLYVALSAGAALVSARWPGRRVTLPILQGALLIDGLYLVTIVALTGGAESPLTWVITTHLVAATLLASYRSGLKLAVWDTLLILVALRAVSDGVVEGVAAQDRSAVALAIAGMWAVTVVTAACSAASERILRTQRADLSSLSSMAARIEERPNVPDITVALLDALRVSFGFRRGAVLLGGVRDLRVATATDDVNPDRVRHLERDATLRASIEDGSTRLVRAIAPEADPALSAFLPEARNVAIVPLTAASGASLGVVVLERGGRAHGIRRWTVSMIERFVAHAALAIANARLRDESLTQLETIELLERDLRAHAAELEDRVAERTAELRETIEILRETDDQRRRLLQHVVHVGEEERRRIANDVHDDPLQKLVALKMRLELLAKGHPEDDGLARAGAAVKGAIHSMRHLLFDLHPPVLDEASFNEALRYLLEQSELPFSWSVEGTADPDEQASVILYRIAQEAVTNARKHSDASRLDLRLQSRDGGTWLEISDDGAGFLPQEAVVAAPGHLGLAAMRERAEMAGGTCELRSLPNAGTTVTVWLPGERRLTEPVDGLAVTTEPWAHSRAS